MLLFLGDDSLTWEPVVESISQIISLQTAGLNINNIIVDVLRYTVVPILYSNCVTIFLKKIKKKNKVVKNIDLKKFNCISNKMNWTCISQTCTHTHTHTDIHTHT